MNVINEFEKYLLENYDPTGEKNTIKSYLSDIKQFLDYFKNHFGEELTDFSRADYIEFKQYLKEKLEYRYSTINRKTASLSIYEDFLIEKRN